MERKGAANPYTSLNGHMFSFIDKTGAMSLRLSKEAMAVFLAEHKAGPSIQYGVVMREYVVIPDDLLADVERTTDYFQQSYEYVASLKLKVTKKNI